MACWLAGLLVYWLAGLLACWLAGWLADWPAGSMDVVAGELAAVACCLAG